MRHFIDETNGSAYEERRHHPLRRHCHRHGMHHPFMRDRNDLEGMYMAVARMMGHEVRRRFGMSQDRIIAILKENGGTMSQRTLQRLLDIKPGSISEILSKMEEKGLIERSKDDEDKRASFMDANFSEAIKSAQRSGNSTEISLFWRDPSAEYYIPA